ncbi:MAG: reverse transcriptase family protein, partial [Pseudomonadota bacterium]
ATLDKVFCCIDSQSAFDVSIAPPLGSAVNLHKSVFVSKRITPSCSDSHLQEVFDLRESNLAAFASNLADSDWVRLFECDDVNMCVSIFYEIFRDAMRAIPVSLVRLRPHTKPWITPVVLDLINKRWRAFREGNFSLYNHYKCKVKREIVKSKLIWSSKMSKTCKGTWTVVNNVRGKRSDNSVNQIVSLFPNAAVAAESVNNFFSDTFVDSKSFSLCPIDGFVSSPLCNSKSVEEFLRSLRTDKSPGSDGIHPRLLRTAAHLLGRPLSYIFNLSFSKGIFPDIWKTADVCPVPKSVPVKLNCLRPISLLPIISKIFEKVILQRYRNALVDCYDSNQFAYRPLSSTVCALLTINETVLRLSEMSDVTAVRILTFDMTKAFDCIPHHLLLSRISEFSFLDRNFFINWLHSYLSNRHQRVKLGNTRSPCVKVTSGVPQGSLLGPYLFALYMSSYKPLSSHVKAVKYADDVTLIIPVFSTDSDDLSLVSCEVNNFKFWCETNQMLINNSKTKVLNIPFSRSSPQSVPGLDNVISVKLLGLFFNSKFSWSDHFEFIVSKMSRRLYILRILKPVMSHDQLILVFNSVIRSLMDYASPVFVNAGAVLNDQLSTICKRAYRIIHGFDRDYRVCNRCSLPDIAERRKELSLKLFVKLFLIRLT